MKLMDLTYLKKVSNNDNETMIEMIEIFEEQCSEFKLDFQKHMDNDNYNELSLLAHKVKSSVAIMGMHNFTLELKKFEELTMNEDEIDSYRKYVENFIETFNKTIIEIQELKLKLK